MNNPNKRKITEEFDKIAIKLGDRERKRPNNPDPQVLVVALIEIQNKQTSYSEAQAREMQEIADKALEQYNKIDGGE